MVKVAFINNQIDNRGTGNALYDYAHYNEEILGNESIIVSMSGILDGDGAMGSKLSKRFGQIYSIYDLVSRDMKIHTMYHIKSGENDGWIRLPGVRYTVHAVFNGAQPHGDRYVTISEWMSKKYNIPYVPHIITLDTPSRDIREQYNIPKDAYVYGRHGGSDTFDISWAWSAINRALKQDESLYFIFMNTDYPKGVTFHDSRRVIFMDATADGHLKSSFIHACDAMLHARSRGETFGMAIGEFAIAEKPVLSYALSHEKAHHEMLGGRRIIYYDENDLVIQLLSKYRIAGHTGYHDCTPENVMKKFKQEFLSKGPFEAY
jgi:hypothetical protein